MASGWKIICPDGNERHCPFHNLGDAEFDARVYTDSKVGKCEGCPGGKHTVEPCVFTPPQPTGSA